MAERRNRPRVVLCATLTADGKLDAEPPAVPPVLYGEAVNPARHPWGALYHAAAAILVDAAVRETLPMPQAAVRAVLSIELDPAEDVPGAITQALELLRRKGAAGDVLCFGGAALFRALLETGLADELRLRVRPKIDGRRGSASLSGAVGEFFPASVTCRLLGMEVVGDECFLHYRVVRGRARTHKTT